MRQIRTAFARKNVGMRETEYPYGTQKKKKVGQDPPSSQFKTQ